MPSLTIKVAGRGTQLRNSERPSTAGHIWISLDNGKGGIGSIGFAPREDFQGSPIAPGHVYTSDDDIYQSTDFERKIDITQEQYEKILDFSKDPEKYGFDKQYNAVSNSCIDFVWKALEVGGLNEGGFDGSLWPTWNIHDIKRIGDLLHPPGSTYVDPDPTPPSDAWRKLTEFDIRKLVNDLFRRSRTATQSSPLVFDLDGDGIEIAQLATAGDGVPPTLFDHDGDGIKTGTAWLRSDDGILVLDRNGNGAIDSGRELFGNHTLLASGQQAADGYAALAELDANADGAIDAQDTRWNQLRLWRDHNQDGIGQAEELSALDTLGLTRIGLNKTDKTQNLGDGTKLDGQAEYTRNGQTRSYTDAWFAENAFYRQFPDRIPLTDEAKGLTNLQGSGMVRDLKEAASLDGNLVTDIQSLVGASRTQMMDSLDALIERWANTSAYKTSIEEALDQKFKLVYLVPGMNKIKARNNERWRMAM